MYLHIYVHTCACTCPLGVIARYEAEIYCADEKTGYVTLALVLDRAVPFPVTVTVRTLDLLDSNIGDTATGELMQ